MEKEKTLDMHLAEQRENIIKFIENMNFAYGVNDYPRNVEEAIRGTKETIAKAIRKNL